MVKHFVLAIVLAGLVYSVTPTIAQDNGSNEQQSELLQVLRPRVDIAILIRRGARKCLQSN